MSDIQITVNGEVCEIGATEATISKLLELREVESPDMVAVQKNGTFVAKDVYGATTLASGDEVEFLFFMGGGA